MNLTGAFAIFFAGVGFAFLVVKMLKSIDEHED